MKITAKRLKEIIMEEMKGLNEGPHDDWFTENDPMRGPWSKDPAPMPGSSSEPSKELDLDTSKLTPKNLIDQIQQQLTDWHKEAPDDEKHKYGALLDLINTHSV